MKILVVQESDWLKRNPHQQHHLMERLALRGHEIRVIDYDIDWRKEKQKRVFTTRKIFSVHKIFPEVKVQVIRPGTLKIPVLDYLSLLFSHRKEIKKQMKEFKPDVIIGFGILNSYIASKIAKNKTLFQIIAVSIFIIYKKLPYPEYLHKIGTIVLYIAVFLTVYSAIEYIIKYSKSLKKL